MLKQYFENMLKTMLKKNSTSEDVFSAFNASYYPKCLFKYRSCNSKHSFDILENDYLWADSPENFHDPFDSVVNADYEKQLFSIEKAFMTHIIEITYHLLPEDKKRELSLEDFRKSGNDFLDESGEYRRSFAKKYLSEREKRMSIEERAEWDKIQEYICSSDIIKSGAEAIKVLLKEINNYLRKSVFVCCLSQNGENMKMWEDYADKYSGFVIEYSLENSDDTLLKTSLCRTFPVKYYKRIPKFDISEIVEYYIQKKIYGKSMDILNTVTELYRQLLYKKFEYASEEEWRIIVSNKESQRIEFPFASAVYGGYKISDENLNKLKEICKKKDIPLYKQELDSIGGRFVYYPVDLSED